MSLYDTGTTGICTNGHTLALLAALPLAGVVARRGTGFYTASTGGDEKAPEAPAATKRDMGAGLRGDSLETKLRGDLKKILDGQTLLGDRDRKSTRLNSSH